MYRVYLSFLVDKKLHMLRLDTFVRKNDTIAGVSASKEDFICECRLPQPQNVSAYVPIERC